MTENRNKLAQIIAKNPAAQGQSETVQQAMKLIENIRNLGAKPKQYDLESPFSDRAWVDRDARSSLRAFKLTEDA